MQKVFFDSKVAKCKQTNIKRWWDLIRGLSEERCTNNCTQKLLCNQLPSFDALADRFNTFLSSLTANFTPLAAQPSGFFLQFLSTCWWIITLCTNH